jgi:hypothetical protein
LGATLGDLNPALGCLPYGPQAYPAVRIPDVYGVCKFGVRQHGRLLSEAGHPIGSSTSQTTSVEVMLRHVSAGTSCCRVRWAFHPYTRVRGGYCRTPSLQASTQLSPRFTLLARRSLGFGSSPRDSPRVSTVALVLENEDCGRIGFPAPARMIRLGLP